MPTARQTAATRETNMTNFNYLLRQYLDADTAKIIINHITASPDDTRKKSSQKRTVNASTNDKPMKTGGWAADSQSAMETGGWTDDSAKHMKTGGCATHSETYSLTMPMKSGGWAIDSITTPINSDGWAAELDSAMKTGGWTDDSAMHMKTGGCAPNSLTKRQLNTLIPNMIDTVPIQEPLVAGQGATDQATLNPYLIDQIFQSANDYLVKYEREKCLQDKLSQEEPIRRVQIKEELNQVHVYNNSLSRETAIETEINFGKETTRAAQSAIKTLNLQEKIMNKQISEEDRNILVAHMVKTRLDAIAADFQRIGEMERARIPELMYMNVQLGESDDPQDSNTVQGLMDTGCTNSILDWYTFVQIPEFNKIKQEEMKKETTILTAAGTRTEVNGQATVKLWIWDNVRKLHIPFYHKFLIATGLREKMYLGRDFIYPEIGNNKSKDLLGVDFYKMDREGLRMDVPLDEKIPDRKPIQIRPKQQLKVPANSIMKVPVTLSRERLRDGTYMVQNTLQNDRKKFELIEANGLMTDNGQDAVAVINTTNKILVLNPSKVMGELEHVDDVPGIHDPFRKVHLTADAKFYFQPCREHRVKGPQLKPELNNLTVQEDSLNTYEYHEQQLQRALDKKEDAVITPEEREQLSQELHREGHTQLPISASNFNTRKLANFETDDEGIPKSKEELLTQIKVDHIPERYRKEMLRVFDEHAEVLETHTFNCPPTPLVEAKIDIDHTKIKEKDCWKCKKFEVPLHLRPAYGKIIDIMLQNDIIEYSQEGSGPCIISNPILVKKKTFQKGQPIKATHLRLCIDLRLVNSIMSSKVVTLPPIRNLLHQFDNAKWMTSLDISNMFFAIPVHIDSRNLLQFYNHNGQLVRLKRLPQGGRTSSWFANDLMQKALGHFSHVKIYCDDIYIICRKREGFTEDDYYRQHIKDIGDVLKALIEAKLKIKPLKVELCKTQMEILGYQWKLGKFNIPDAKVSAICNLKKPETQTQLKSYLSTLSFYRNNLPRLSQVEALLSRMTRGGAARHDKVTWTAEASEAYENSKTLCKQAYDIEPPVLGEEFFLCSDASGLAASGVLWQYIDGKVRFVGCSGRQFNKHEENLSIYEKELLALTNLISNFSFCLDGTKQITCYIDSRSLIFLALAKNSNSKLIRMANQLTAYPLKIVHIRSKVNALADAYSRLMTLKEETDHPYIDKSFAAQFCEELVDLHAGFPISDNLLARLLTEQSPRNPTKKLNSSNSTKRVVEADNLGPLKQGTKLQKKPPKFTKLRARNQEQIIHQSPRLDHWSKKGNYRLNNMETETESDQRGDDDTPLDDYDSYDHEPSAIERLVFTARTFADGAITLESFKRAQEIDAEIAAITSMKVLPKKLHMSRGILVYVPKDDDPERYRLYLPRILVKTLLNSYHFNVLGMHRSKEQLYKAIAEKYYCRNLKQMVDAFSDQCWLCKTQKKRRGRQKPLIGQKAIYMIPREHYQFDICEMPMANGYQYCYVWVDLATNFTVLAPAKDRSAAEVRKSLERDIIRIFGIPTSIYCDNEKATESSLVREVCHKLDIKYAHTAPYSPQSNPNAEGAVGLAKDIIRIYTKQMGKSWTDILHLANPSLNTRFLSKTYLTPERLLFGRTNQSRELLRCHDLPENTQTEEYAQALENKQVEMREIHNAQRKRDNEKNAENANKGRKFVRLNLNDIVHLYNNEIKKGRGAAMDQKYSGPYQIWEIHSGGQTYTLKDLETGKLRRAHIEHLELATHYPHEIVIPVELENSLKHLRPIRSESNLLSSSRRDLRTDSETTASTTPTEYRTRDRRQGCSGPQTRSQGRLL